MIALYAGSPRLVLWLKRVSSSSEISLNPLGDGVRVYDIRVVRRNVRCLRQCDCTFWGYGVGNVNDYPRYARKQDASEPAAEQGRSLRLLASSFTEDTNQTYQNG